VLLQQASESLAGRVAQLELMPFQAREVLPSDATSLRWRDALIVTYLKRDIPGRGPSIPVTTLRRLWTMLTHGQGGLLNQSQLAAAPCRATALPAASHLDTNDLETELPDARWH